MIEEAADFALLTSAQRRVPPGRMARIRATPECGPIARRSKTAWTTSADPPIDANMRRATALDRGENLSPATHQRTL